MLKKNETLRISSKAMYYTVFQLKKYYNQQAFLLQLPLKQTTFISACLLFPPKAGYKIQSHPKAMLPAKNWASLGKSSKHLTVISDASTAGNAASCMKR